MSVETARQGLVETLFALSDDRVVGVSSTEHELSTAQLYELADQIREEHDADVDIVWLDDGTLAYRYWRNVGGNGA